MTTQSLLGTNTCPFRCPSTITRLKSVSGSGGRSAVELADAGGGSARPAVPVYTAWVVVTLVNSRSLGASSKVWNGTPPRSGRCMKGCPHFSTVATGGMSKTPRISSWPDNTWNYKGLAARTATQLRRAQRDCCGRCNGRNP
jgi:hypothetical protein